MGCTPASDRNLRMTASRRRFLPSGHSAISQPKPSAERQLLSLAGGDADRRLPTQSGHWSRRLVLNQATAATLGLDPAALLGSPQAALPPPMPPAENLRASSIRAIQSRLRGLGFYTVAVDGVWGQSTQSAIERLQQGRGLQPNGQLNPTTLGAMGLSPDSLIYR
jgi:hypothetical protein